MTAPLRGVRSRAWAPPGLKRLMAGSLARGNLVTDEIVGSRGGRL
jgi:hypothetical protein